MKSTGPAYALALVAVASILVGGTPSVSAKGGQVAEAPSLAAVLAAAGQYVTQFRDQLSGIVAEERYRQRASTPSLTTKGFLDSRVRRRELRSDFLLIRPEGEDRYYGFRDVFEVDGRAIRDRQERLTRLFLDPSLSADRQIRGIRM